MPRLPYAIENALRRMRRAIGPRHAIAAGGGLALIAGLAWWLVRDVRPARVGDVDAPPRADGTLRLATFDLDGLYDARDDAGEADDTPTPEPRLREIADLILRADADILALQGVESRDALAWFRDAYIGSASYTHLASLDVGHENGLECAVLSRYPIRNPRALTSVELQGGHPPDLDGKPNPFAGRPLRFNRAPLAIEVDAPRAQGGVARLLLVVVDAKGGDKFEYWRGAEASAIIGFTSAFALPTAILGSFHAEPGDPSIDAFLAAGFTDVFAGAHDSARLQTETSGDRTTLVLVNAGLAPSVNPGRGFVLAPHEPSVASKEAVHLPLVAEIDASRL